MLIFTLFSLAKPDFTYAANWIDLMAKGKDEQAAIEFRKILEKMPRSSDPGMIAEWEKTADAIEKGCKVCKEKDKIFLFRSVGSGLEAYDDHYGWSRSDLNAGSRERPLFLSRSLMTPQKAKAVPDGMKRISRYNKGSIMVSHKNSARKGIATFSPYISTSFSTPLSPPMLVLKICPERVFVNSFNNFYSEQEVLIKLFIHPSEVAAILGSPKNPRDKFSILFNGLGDDDEMAMKTIKKALLDQKKASRGSAGRGFEDSVNYYMKYKKPLTMSRWKTNECSRFFNKLWGFEDMVER